MKNSITVWHEAPELVKKGLDNPSLDIKVKMIQGSPFGHRSFPLVVLPAHCSDCIICEGSCPNLKFDKENKIMIVNPIACRGCGVCISSCPTGALQQRDSYLGGMEKDIFQFLESDREETPAICNQCPIVTAEVLPPRNGTNNVRLMCSGRFEPATALDALAKGFQGVLVIGCLYTGFPFERNRFAVEERQEFLESLSLLLGLDSGRIVYVPTHVSEGCVLECLRKSVQA